jgi:hypothetical protein
MLLGSLDQRGRSIVRLQVRGKSGSWTSIGCEIDTGAEPELLTSQAWLGHLDAETEPGDLLTLPDGREAPALYAVLEVEWFGQVRLVDVVTPVSFNADTAFRPPARRGSAPNALLGRGLLSDCRLTIDYGRANVSIDRSEGAAA